MTIETMTVQVRGLPVSVVRKPIKNVHLSVYPPDGHVRIAVPTGISDPAVRLAIIDKLGWIHRQQDNFRAQVRESAREMVNGESHWFGGRRYRLNVSETTGRNAVRVSGRTLELRCRPGSSRERRAAILDRWYRAQLRELLPPLLTAWEQRLEVTAAEWHIKRMKTKWGSCNASARRLWFNVELAKKPPRCLEYVVAHELVHFVVRRHGAAFIALMDQSLPKWRSLRQELGQLPLGGGWWGDS